MENQSEISELFEKLTKDLAEAEGKETEILSEDPEAARNNTKAKAFRFHLLILHRRKWTLMHEISAEEDDVRRLLLIKALHEVRKEALK